MAFTSFLPENVRGSRNAGVALFLVGVGWRDNPNNTNLWRWTFGVGSTSSCS
ncbi:hypothetical protein BRADI_1g28733v3 [Brachypodium distachyon]|uniref:Uncharacterized protein n=1 Tax=Brachypodium distachyon TaxID=15368 RepID=A0A2K2DLR1_BRADI|nr:hypothetical protein BRADI_1g28733v3 [Brachypodium distachyon]